MCLTGLQLMLISFQFLSHLSLPKIPSCAFIIVWLLCFFFFFFTVFIFPLFIPIWIVSSSIYILINHSLWCVHSAINPISYNFYFTHIFLSLEVLSKSLTKLKNFSTFLSIWVIFIVTILISLSTNSIIYVISRFVLIDWVFFLNMSQIAAS